MGRADYYSPGDWNVQCWQCGFKRKASQMEKNWQGFYVCPEHNEPRQTQDFVRGVPDMQVPPWTQPWAKTVYTYNRVVCPGIADGVNKKFQMGSGLGPDAVTYTLAVAFINNTVIHTVTIDDHGVITFTIAPDPGSIITANGTETVLA